MSQIFQVVPIKELYESPMNPRKIYSEKGLEELTESIKTKGILTPLLVRPNDGRLEIAAGHRRYRAALRLDLAEIPVLIREMSDNDFLELITIENLQREDVHPLDEAQGYRTLIERTGLDVPSIAAKVGKSISYVYQRLKLGDLIPQARGAFSSKKITAGHAILIARLQPNEQKDVLAAIEEDRYGDQVMSVRDVADYIERHIHLDLNSASFSKKDPDLIPEAGPCVSCPKRTGFQPELFPDIKKKDICTDPGCFERKVEAYTTRWIQKKSEDSDVPPLKLSGDQNYRTKKVPDDPKKPIPANLYHEITDRKKGSCESAREGIITEGRNKGKVLTVCTDPKCKIHNRYSGSSDPEMSKYRAQQKIGEKKKKEERDLRIRILEAIVAKSPKEFSQKDYSFLASSFFGGLWDDYRRQIANHYQIKPIKTQYSRDYQAPMKVYIEKLDKPSLQALLIEIALMPKLEKPWSGRRQEDILLSTAGRYRVDIKAIEATFRKELKEKEASQKEKAKKKDKRAAKPKSGVCRICGCTETTPCVDPTIQDVCAWADKTKTLCSACKKKKKQKNDS